MLNTWKSSAFWQGVGEGWRQGCVVGALGGFAMFAFHRGHYILGSLVTTVACIISWFFLRCKGKSSVFRSFYAVWGPPGLWLARKSESTWRIGLGRLTLVYAPIDLDIFVLMAAREFVRADREGKPIPTFEELRKYEGAESHVST